MIKASAPAHGDQEATVGWICALQTEYVVACELLDEEFPDMEVTPDDENAYTCGRIGAHIVVVACLPKGRYGLTSAASVAKDMLRSFPKIRIGLMVGIGGGAPSAKNDIRLGDIVVSTPVGQAGGVIHYEHGKAIQNKEFERTGSLDAPPTALLNAVQRLSTQHARQGHRIKQTIETMLTKNPRLVPTYQKPPPESDILYTSSFTHPNPTQPCLTQCPPNPSQIIPRDPRPAQTDSPTIHYGLIASSDKLMKNAQVRDHLFTTEHVLCFEMEAAGLMDRFKCLVIRGICDYSDTHKNDAWQGYAAAAAAAYARELLLIIPASESREMMAAAMPLSGQGSGLDRHQDRGVVFHTYGDVSNMAADQTIHGSVTFN